MKVASGPRSVPRPESSTSFVFPDQNDAENLSGSDSPFRLSYTVLQEKRARKAAEDDAVRLCNRVKQLQKEADKASKRVSDTRKKINDVRSQQQRLVDKQAEKDKWQREIKEEVDRQRFLNILSRQQNRQNKSLSEVQLHKERLSQAEEAKEESAEIERVLAESKLLARIEALERKEAVRKEYKKSLEQQNKFRADKIKLAHGDYEKRLQEQRGARESKQRELSNLGKMEEDLLRKLRQMETDHTRAEEELCTLLQKPKPQNARSPHRSPGSTSPSPAGHAAPQNELKQAFPTAAQQRQQQQQQQLQPQFMDQSSSVPSMPRSSGPHPPQQRQSAQGPNPQGSGIASAEQDNQDGLSEIQEGDEEPLPDFSDEEIAAAFARYDRGGSGVMQVSDLADIMSDLQMRLDSEQLMQAAQQLDGQGTGQISFGEFLVWWRG